MWVSVLWMNRFAFHEHTMTEVKGCHFKDWVTKRQWLLLWEVFVTFSWIICSEGRQLSHWQIRSRSSEAWQTSHVWTWTQSYLHEPQEHSSPGWHLVWRFLGYPEPEPCTKPTLRFLSHRKWKIINMCIFQSHTFYSNLLHSRK